VSYRVKRGDTLQRIASLHGVTVGDLKSWNGMRTDRIVVGDRLTVRGDTGTRAAQ
jgi:LysM repeat protein